MIDIGDSYEFTYTIPENKTVPHLFPESPEFQEIPAVFATGFMVGLMEWTCIQHLNPFLRDDQTSLGVLIETSHSAASSPGMTVSVVAQVTKVTERKIEWSVVARDNRDVIGEGRHVRAVVARDRFMKALQEKSTELGISTP